MKKKTIGILLMISLVIIISIGAISAADTNDTLLEEVGDTDDALQVEASDANIATTSVAFENDNATSLGSESGGDVEISAIDNSDELSNQKLGASSNLNQEVLSASNDDVLKASSGCFYYAGKWYDDLEDAVDEACDNNGGTIKIKGGTYGSDSDDVKITISDGVDLTFEPESGQVIFDGSKNDKWFFKIADDNAHVTFNSITFRNGGAFQGGAIEVDEGQLNVNYCTFEGNKAFQNLAGGYGWGGAIYLDDDSCSLIARNCRFINNKAASGGGAVCVEGDGSTATFYNCYFEGNKQGDEDNDVYDKDQGDHSFSECDFIGHGSIEFTVNYVDKSVVITPEVEDQVNYLALYHYGESYRSTDCNSGSTKTFSNLEDGSYTIYMKYNNEKRFIYKDASFRIVANDFILNDNQPYESLSAAVNAIPDGGTGVITVKGGIYTESENFNVKIKNNKKVTIKASEGALESVIFSSPKNQYFLVVDGNSHLIIEDITMKGKFETALRFFSGSRGTISNCEFENMIPYYDSSTVCSIFAGDSNLELNDCTFESNKGQVLCQGSCTLNINDCTFAHTYGDLSGGAINAGYSQTTITNSKFIGNEARSYGGAIYGTNLKIYDTEFIGNSARIGGAIYMDRANSINITGCIFDSNTATEYRNIYSGSPIKEGDLQFNEYDLNLSLKSKDDSYGREYILEGTFDWGSNLKNDYTVLMGIFDDETIFGDVLTIEDNKFKINGGVLSAGSHNITMPGMYLQADRLDHFYGQKYYSDLYGNEFYLNDIAFVKILIDKAKIELNLEVKSVLIPETPVLNVCADQDLNYTIFIGDKYYQLEVVNGKASMPLTGLDLGNYTVVGMRDADENYELVINFTTFSISKTYSNFLVLSTNVEYDTLGEAVANSNYKDSIYIKKGTYTETGIVISDKVLDIIALEGAVFDARGRDANFIIVQENALVDIYGITFTGLRNRNTNYGAIVNHGYLSVDSCTFTDNKITKTSFAGNGGAAIFSDGDSLDIDNCIFINNVAPLKVSTAAVTSLGDEDVSITSSKFINNSAREGGALHFKNISQFEAAIASSDFEHNTAVKGSAIYVGNNSKYLSVTLSDFRDNDIKNNFGENTQLEGGVIYVNANTGEVILDVSLSTFENNSNSNVDGGVIFLDGSSKATIESCIFNNNKGKLGSVILIKNPYDKKLTLVIDSSSFTDNHATNGAVATSPKVTTLIDECLFANNTGQNRHIYSNGFTIVHDSIFEVKDAKLTALSVQYGENSIISGTADIGTNIYATANLTVAGENIMVEIENNTFSYKTGILNHGKYYAVLNNIVDSSNNEYLMDSITEIFRVYRNGMELNVSVDNITYGETLKVVEKLPLNAIGTIDYQLNGRYYTKDEIEALKLDAGKYTLVAIYDHEDYAFTSSTVNFEVYKANPTITVADVEVRYNDTIILNIETNVPSIYTIEIEDYKTVTFINGSKSIEIEKTFEIGNHTIKVTSQGRVNYISNFTEAVLIVNKNLPVFMLSGADKVIYPDDALINVSAPDNAVGNISYTVLDSHKNIVYTITQSCREDLIIPTLDAGTYEINAIFEGDDLYDSTDNIQLTFRVYPGEVNLTLQFNDITCGEDLVIIPEFNRQNIQGEITYVVGENIKTLPVNESYVVKGLDEGNYTIVAFYMGCDNYDYCKYVGTVNVRKNNPLLGASKNIHGKSSMTSSSIMQSATGDVFLNEETPESNAYLLSSPDNNILGDEYDEYKFLYQYDEDSDYEYYKTLEEAIDEAVSWGAGIITVRGGTYSGEGFYGIEIEGEHEITIKAYEGEEVIFDCKNESYFLHLTYETQIEWTETTPPVPYETQTEGPTVTLENITVINGYNIEGGAIEMDAGTLTLLNCNFSNNNAVSGGAIYIGSINAEESATLIGLNTTFTNNYASYEGGAIYVGGLGDDSASFYLCTFLDNYQGEDENKKINYFAGFDKNIVRKYCTFNGNGTIYRVDIDKINQTVTINGTSSDVFDSVVLVYFDQAPLYSIYNNGSHNFYLTFEDVMGGNYTLGVMNEHDFNTYLFDVKFEIKVPNFIISESEVYENLTDAIDAVPEGGIIYANVNYYDEDNMEIDIHKSFTLKNFRDRDVIFDGSDGKWLFTIDNGCTVIFDGIYFAGGAVKTHAAIENYGTLIIKNCLFDSFETGAIIYNSGLLNVSNSEFSLNFADNAIVWNDAELFIDTVEFSNNFINISSVVYTNGVAKIVSSNFTENYNGGNGGAIYSTNSLNVENTVFSENEGKDGGAVYNTGILDVLNCTFEDNNANGYGGAIFNGNEANIVNSTFTGGFSEKDGGALYNNHTMTVDNSTFVGDSATGNGGAIYNSRSLVLTKSFFGINFAGEYANIYNAGDIQFSENTFDFYDVILIVPDGQYGIPTTITGTLNPEFNMDIQLTLPGFVDNNDTTVTISDGIFEYVTDILPKGTYDVKLNEINYDGFGNIYYGESVSDRLIIHKANVYINLTVGDMVIHSATVPPVLKIDTSKIGSFHILFNNRLFDVNITDAHTSLTLDAVGEGNYSVLVFREGDENYNDAVNTTTFKVSEYEGNFIVNSTGNQFETLREALADSSNDDIIYVREGNYTGADNLGLTISNKKLSIISLGDVVFDGNSSRLGFLTVESGSDVTLCDVVIRGFNENTPVSVIKNRGNVTLDGCTFVNNTLESKDYALIDSGGNLTIVGSGFYDNILYQSNIILSYAFNLIVNESTFENNTIYYADLIVISSANSAKIISNAFGENRVSTFPYSLIEVYRSTDVLISSAFYNNTLKAEIIYATRNTNLIVNNSIFTGNNVTKPVSSKSNGQIIISECTFTENTVENVVLSDNDKNLSVLESVFSDNTLSGYGALNIASDVNATVNGSVFTNNKADKYRNIYSVCDVNISNSVFDAVNVDFTVHDMDYGQNETINGTIDIGTNLNFTVNLDINSKSYSVNVTDNKFTLNAGILNGGDYTAALNAKDNNSNTYVFNKITKIFTVNRIDPGLSVSIENITEGEKLNVTSTIDKKAKGNVVYELNGVVYSKAQLENLTLNHGNYLVTAMYRGDKNFLSAIVMTNVEVNKVAPNITVNDVAVNYGDEIKINVSVDVADYYTVFIGNESLSLYVEDSAIFTFPSEGFKPDNYEIVVYVFETDDYYEAYGYANLTVNKAIGVFNLSDDTIIYGENATIRVNASINAYGNISYEVYDEDMELVYNITQSCLEELVVPNLSVGTYKVIGTFEGDSYYTNESIINSGIIVVNVKAIDLNITVSNITYTEDAVVFVYCDVDGEYLVYVGNEPILVTVVDGSGNESVSDLYVGSYVVNATAVDGNYSAFNETVFEVTPKEIPVFVSVDDITYGEDAVVWVYSDVDGDYLVEVYGQYYPVTVDEGEGNTTIYDLFVDEDILVSVSIVDGNYSVFNATTFDVIPKETSVVISVDDITYGEDAVVIVVAEVDGEYLVELYDQNCTVNVVGGEGNTTISDLFVDEDILVFVSIVDGNYSAFNATTFNIAPKEIPVIVSVGNITYGEDAVVVVQSDVDGDYIVNILDETYTVSVNGGNGVKFIPGLGADEDILVSVSNVDGNYSAFNVTTFDVVPKQIDVLVSVDDITYGEDAVVIVEAEVDGEYLVYVGDEEFVVTVSDGVGDVAVSNLTVGSYVVDVSVVDGNYSGSDFTSFDVEIRPIDVLVSVDDITYGEDAVVIVVSEVDGEYLVYVGDEEFVVTVSDGVGDVAVSNLTVGSYVVDVTVVDGNYSGFNFTSFDVEVKPIDVLVSVDDIAYGEDALVIVVSEVDGEYLVYVDDDSYIVDVDDGMGGITVSNLTAGTHVVTVTVVDGNYSGFDSTSFEVIYNPQPKEDATISIDAPAISEGENATVTVTLPSDATGFVTIGDEIIPVNGGVASAVLVNLPVGNTEVPITYSGDDKYNSIETSAVVTVNVKPDPHKENLTISAVADPITVGEDAVIAVSGLKGAAGNVTVTVNGKTYAAPIVKGSTSVSVPGLTENVTAVVNYAGDEIYNPASTTVKITVSPQSKENATIIIDVPEVTEGQNATVTVTLPKDAKGNVTAVVGGKNYTVPVKNGTAKIILPDLAKGNYTIPVTYSGDDKYDGVTKDVTVNVKEDTSDKISAPDVTKYYKGDERFVVTVTDYKGNPLANKEVKININGKEYTRTTDEKGIASMAIGLPSNTYPVTVTVDNQTVNSVVTVLPTVNGTDLVKVYKNASQYYATFRDSQGNYLAQGTEVTFNINGVMYTRKVAENGLAKLNINLPQGVYVITAINPITGENAANNITIIPRIVENNDLTKYFRNASQYTVKLIGDDGNPVGAGESVTFNINGVFYTRTTDASGIAKLNINLPPGDYIITAEYRECKVSNNIKVLPTLTGKDLTKKYGQAGAFEATLVDDQGKPYASQKISFNINGVFYEKTTDASGIAKLNINLPPGEYIVTSSYGQASISNKVTVTV